MPRHTFSIGDRVRCKALYVNEDYQPPAGVEGTVVELDGQYLLYVDFGTAWKSVLGKTICHLNHEYVEPAPVRAFYLVAIQDGQEVMLKDHPTFDTGRSASAYCAELSHKLGCKVQPRRLVVENSDWRQREQARIDSGEYPKLPAGWTLTPIADHFLHLAQRDPTMLAFTESVEKGVLDRQTLMSPGKYINRFYPGMPQEEMKRFIAMVDKLPDLKFARTADEVERVYTYGPNSCMAGPYEYDCDEDEEEDYHYGIRDDRDRFDGYCHPVRVYGDSDLAVAYLERGDKVTARAVVWPEKKIWIRTYGDCARLERALEAEGYQQGSAQGARIRRLWDKRRRALVMPYLDGVQSVRDPGQGDFVFIDEDGGVDCQNTSGLADQVRICERSGRAYGEEYDFITVTIAVEPEVKTQEWVYSEAAEHAVCVNTSASYFSHHQWFAKNICTRLGESEDDCLGVMPNHLLEEKCFKSAGNGAWYDNDSAVIISGDRMVSYHEADGCSTCSGNGKMYFDHEGQFVDTQWYSNEYLRKKDERNARRREMRQLKKESQAELAA